MSKDGGPAYPVECRFGNGELIGGVQTGNRSGWHTGMTLRDYFAAAALKGLLSNDVALAAIDERAEKLNIDQFSIAARDAYHYAEAMIAERDKR